MIDPKRTVSSISYALTGLKYVWKNEQNFRIQCMAAIGVIVAMIFFQVTIAEAIVLTMLIIFVLVLEVVNTVMEKIVDILKPRIHSYVGVIKDMMAAAVLLAATGSAIVAGMIFIPYIIELVRAAL